MIKPRIRCSELDRILRCPGSRPLTALVAPREGDEATEGSRIHWETAWRLVEELKAVQPEGGLPAWLTPYRLPPFSAWIPEWCVNVVKNRVPTTWALEVEVPLEWEFDRFILTGHEDVAATSPDGQESDDFDWKGGRIPVLPADCNEQVAGYLALRRLNYGIVKARFTIGQPCNDEDDGFERLSTVTIDGADKLDALVATLESRVNYALDHSDELESGLSQCKYCSAATQCPAIALELEAMKTRLTPEILAAIRQHPDDATLARLVMSGRTLARPIDDAEDLLKERLAVVGTIVTDGTTITMKESSAGFKVVNPCGMFGWLRGLLTDDQLAPALNYPGGKIKGAIAKGLGIPETGKAPTTAKSVFEGGAAAFIEPRTKKMLQFT